MSRRRLAALATVVALAMPGCALTSKAEPLAIRWFAPATPPPRPAPDAAAAAGARLRLGRIEASDHLQERIVYRTSDVELAAYEDLRWTEEPEHFLRRALARSLFEEHRLVQALAGGAPTLDVELVAFEELRRGGDRFAVVAAHVALHDDRVVLDTTTVRVEVPVGDPDDAPPRLAHAMGAALDEATRQIAARVAGRLTHAGRDEKDGPASSPPR